MGSPISCISQNFFFLIYGSNLIYKYQIKEFDIILSLDIKKMLSGIQECIKGGSVFIVESVWEEISAMQS